MYGTYVRVCDHSQTYVLYTVASSPAVTDSFVQYVEIPDYFWYSVHREHAVLWRDMYSKKDGLYDKTMAGMVRDRDLHKRGTCGA